MTRSKEVKVTRPLKLEILQFSKPISSGIFNVSWQMTTDSETMEQYLNFVRTRFLISVLVFVSHDYKLGTVKLAYDTPDGRPHSMGRGRPSGWRLSYASLTGLAIASLKAYKRWWAPSNGHGPCTLHTIPLLLLSLLNTMSTFSPNHRCLTPMYVWTILHRSLYKFFSDFYDVCTIPCSVSYFIPTEADRPKHTLFSACMCSKCRL